MQIHRFRSFKHLAVTECLFFVEQETEIGLSLGYLFFRVVFKLSLPNKIHRKCPGV